MAERMYARNGKRALPHFVPAEPWRRKRQITPTLSKDGRLNKAGIKI